MSEKFSFEQALLQELAGIRQALEAMSRLEHSRHHNNRHPREKTCAHCGGVFTPEATKRKRAKTCSQECFSALAAAHKTKFDHEARQGMKRMRAEGATFKEIAERYGASLSRTYSIVNDYGSSDET